MTKNILAFACGVLFSTGLLLSGMTQPAKVIGFLDVFGNWDPTLAFVLLGAVAFHMATYPFIRKKESPILTESWSIPSKKEITPSLVLGSMLFGLGWGLAGYCPGPGVTAAASLDARPILFVAGLLGGMFVYRIACANSK